MPSCKVAKEVCCSWTLAALSHSLKFNLGLNRTVRGTTNNTVTTGNCLKRESEFHSVSFSLFDDTYVKSAASISKTHARNPTSDIRQVRMANRFYSGPCVIKIRNKSPSMQGLRRKGKSRRGDPSE
jgi:hypothetical protein